MLMLYVNIPHVHTRTHGQETDVEMLGVYNKLAMRETLQTHEHTTVFCLIMSDVGTVYNLLV